MILLKVLLENLKIKDATFFHRATVGEVQALSINLVRSGFIRVPRGYLNFLSLSDGLVWNGLELFSCGQHERSGTVFSQPDLFSYQTKYGLGQFFSKYLVLGRAPEYLICYVSTDKSYHLIDRWHLKTVLKFPRFSDLLYYLTH